MSTEMSWCWVCPCSIVNTTLTCKSCGRECDRRVIHSKKAVVYMNPRTGERRIPPTADQPMPEVYARQGYVRTEIESMTQFERSTGLIHEDSNYASGSGAAERDLAREPETVLPDITDRLVRALQ